MIPPEPSSQPTPSRSVSSDGSDRPGSETPPDDLTTPTARWKTVLSFVIGDVLGFLVLFGGLYLFAEAFGLRELTAVYPSLRILLPVLLLSFALVGLYRGRFAHPALEMQQVATVTGTIGVTAALSVLLAGDAPGLVFLIAVGCGLGMLVLPLARVFTRIVCARFSWWGRPAVILASGENGESIVQTLRRWPEIGLRPVAVLNDTPGDDVEEEAFRSIRDVAPRLAQNFDIPYALVAMPSLSHGERANLLRRYTKFFDHVLVVPDEVDSPAVWTTVQSGDGLFGYSVRRGALHPAARYTKRFIDVVGAGIITLLLFPVLLGIAIWIRKDSPGPVFFRQERMGRKGRIFTVMKFRTMYENADEKLAEILESDPEKRREYERYHKLEDDPRVTSVGRILRRYSLDELPQIFNVLRGEMSLVGPRAYMPSELPEMNRLARTVLQVRPGITGLWQVSGRNQLSFSERVDLDVHYIQNWSIWLDLYLLVKTIPTVLTGEGAS